MCEFQAEVLLKMKREAGRVADSARDQERATDAMRFCMQVDQLRLAHEDLTGCECWYAAVASESQTEAAAA
jgi:hypothetical protein